MSHNEPSSNSPISWDLPSPYLHEVRVGPDHIDGLQHVNNAVFVSWCQDAGWAHSRQLGLGLDDYQRLDRAMAIRHGEYDYIQSAYLDQTLLVGTWLTASDGRLTMERRFQVIRACDGVTVLRARWQLVCIEISSGRPKRTPTEFKNVYGSAIVAMD